MSISDITKAELKELLGDRCLGNAGIAIGTTKSKVKTVNAVPYCIGGKAYTLAATDDLFVHTDLTVQPASTTRAYLLCVNAAGTALVVREVGPPSFSPGTRKATSGKVPPLPAGYAPIGVLVIVTGASNTYTPATTLNDAAGITATYINLSGMIASAV